LSVIRAENGRRFRDTYSRKAASMAFQRVSDIRRCHAIGEQASRKWTYLDEGGMIGRLNGRLRGWENYFNLGAVS
jgi:hypothetical protein